MDPADFVLGVIDEGANFRMRVVANRILNAGRILLAVENDLRIRKIENSS